MNSFQLSARARTDLSGIIRYTQQEWGQNQAIRYFDLLEDAFHLLAENPLLGRPADPSNPQHRRLERGSHVLIYRAQKDGVVILRILHKSMLPSRHKP